MYAAWSPRIGGSEGVTPREKRERLVGAFTKMAAERGYERTGVREIAAEAGLLPSDFHECFRDMQQCFLAAYDHFLDSLFEEIDDAMPTGAPWPQQVEAGVTAALEFVVESAAVARLFAVEAHAIGPIAMDRYNAAIQRTVALLRLGRRSSPEAAELPLLTEPVLVAGAISMVGAALLGEEGESLSELSSQLTEVLLFPYMCSGRTQSPAARVNRF